MNLSINSFSQFTGTKDFSIYFLLVFVFSLQHTHHYACDRVGGCLCRITNSAVYCIVFHYLKLNYILSNYFIITWVSHWCDATLEEERTSRNHFMCAIQLGIFVWKFSTEPNKYETVASMLTFTFWHFRFNFHNRFHRTERNDIWFIIFLMVHIDRQ